MVLVEDMHGHMPCKATATCLQGVARKAAAAGCRRRRRRGHSLDGDVALIGQPQAYDPKHHCWAGCRLRLVKCRPWSCGQGRLQASTVRQTAACDSIVACIMPREAGNCASRQPPSHLATFVLVEVVVPPFGAPLIQQRIMQSASATRALQGAGAPCGQRSAGQALPVGRLCRRGPLRRSSQRSLLRVQAVAAPEKPSAGEFRAWDVPGANFVAKRDDLKK